MDKWPNGVPIISDDQRNENLHDPHALRDLIATLWLYIGFNQEKKLTTEQKELLADVVERKDHIDSLEPFEYDRWWRR